MNNHERGSKWISWPAVGVFTVAAVVGLVELPSYVADHTDLPAPYISGINDNDRSSLPNIQPRITDTNNVSPPGSSPTDVPECRIVPGVC